VQLGSEPAAQVKFQDSLHAPVFNIVSAFDFEGVVQVTQGLT
jgi:hypothetical protein